MKNGIVVLEVTYEISISSRRCYLIVRTNGFIIHIYTGLTGYFSLYDRSTESFDDVEARTRIRGWSEEYRCTLRQGTIIALETCIEDRFEDPIIPDFMKDKILRTLEAVRPDVSSIGNIKLDHNNICQDYPDVLFIVEDHF